MVVACTLMVCSFSCRPCHFFVKVFQQNPAWGIEGTLNSKIYAWLTFLDQDIWFTLQPIATTPIRLQGTWLAENQVDVVPWWKAKLAFYGAYQKTTLHVSIIVRGRTDKWKKLYCKSLAGSLVDVLMLQQNKTLRDFWSPTCESLLLMVTTCRPWILLDLHEKLARPSSMQRVAWAGDFERSKTIKEYQRYMIKQKNTTLWNC